MSLSPLVAGLVAAAAALLLRGLTLVRARRDRERLASAALLSRFAPVPARGSQAVRALLLAAGVGLVAAVAAGAGGREVVHEERPGPETVLVLDASNSMLAADVGPSRLERQRILAGRLAARLPGKAGVVYFAGRGYVLAPLTADASAVRMLVDAVRPASVGRGGTALAAGLSEALSVLAGGRSATAAVVLFSDGEETVGGPLEEVIARAARDGIPVHTVGIGTAQGGRIPLTPDAAGDPLAGLERPRGMLPGGREATREFLRGPDGEEVVTRLHEETLLRIAQGTGGAYWAADEATIDALAERLSAGVAEPARGGWVPSAGWLLLAAFALLWLEAFARTGGAPAGARRGERGPGADVPGRRGASERPEASERRGASKRDAARAGRAAALSGLLALAALTSAAGGPTPEPERLRPAAGEGGAQATEPETPGVQRAESPLVSRYREEAERRDRPLDWYNLGTALLREGRWEEAVEPLRRAAVADPGRIRAYGEYNHGLAGAERGRSEGERPEARRESLLQARESFRAVLRGDAADEDARWNLELVERWLEQPPVAGAGGGGGGSGGGGDDGAGADGLDREAAEALLEEAARAEAELRERVLERTRMRDPVVERNW